ncbi:MAG: Asp-tRNA(Asn)/Glu-tRNA(Gln) amidotransferase subunit GatB [Candidatus Pacebacteria bacterium]|nr:Asp-tRNA(Asn)/Glu-tRNA(Gln) amidotransferase subunit GatB [Candidatus Paceibacterota bacterium]
MTNKYEPTIGMEVHVELKTNSKMFCSCANNPDEIKPNKNICPVCMGHPGTLPVANKKAVEYVIKTGLALGCKIAEFSKFDRKNYFYPDLPKGYQISQYDQPLCEKGNLLINDRKIGITRIHLEEDTGKLLHPKGADYSLVDLNRAGTPLMELVTEPEIKSSAEAKEFCKQFQLIVKYIGVSDADMEKGHMRCEVNISLKPKGQKEFGTKVEIKNLNSFRAVERSIEYEIKRQAEVLDEGGKIVQETRGWDADKQQTYSQRKKEEAHDYRYFPEPDLPPLDLTKKAGLFDVQKIKEGIPELPLLKKYRFINQYKLTEENAKILSEDKELANYFEEIISELKHWIKDKGIDGDKLDKLTKLTANYILTELQRLLYKNGNLVSECKITAENFAEFITLIDEGKISSSGAQTMLVEMYKTGGDPSNILDEKGLEQVSDESAIEEIIDEVIKNNSQSVKDYKSGKEVALKFLVGQTMKESKGKANPQIAGEILKKKLKL